MDEINFGENIMEAIHKQIINMTQLNLMVIGKTGAGKSTLINSVFREDLATTGIGRPQTLHIEEISKADFPLHLWDTRGFEIGGSNDKEILDEILNKIRSMNQSHRVNERLHGVWYCISTPSHRVDDAEIDIIRQLADERNVPVIIVLTQSYSRNDAQALKTYLRDEHPELHVASIVPVLAKDFEIDGQYVVKAAGLDTLVEVMEQTLPDELKKTLSCAQKTSLKNKRKQAFAAVAAAGTAAAAAAAVPIPLADSAMLFPTQVSMLAGISVIFGTEVNKTIINSLLSGVLGATGATVVGRKVFANLLKLIPGVGSAAGGVISAVTASTITVALGTAYTEMMTGVYNGEIAREMLGTSKGSELFKEYFKNYRRCQHS